MPEADPERLPNKTFIGLPGRNIRLAQSNTPVAATTSESPHLPAPLNVNRRSRSKSPLGITVDTSVGRNGAAPQLLGVPSARGDTDYKRRSSMLLIPSFGSDQNRVSKRKDAPAALPLESSLSPSDRDVPLVLSAASPEFLRLNSKHGKKAKMSTISSIFQTDKAPTPGSGSSLSGSLQSAPPIIIVTPTENLPPASLPRRTQTAPPKPPRSSSVYTRNTRLFSQFQTPRADHGPTPPLPKLPNRYRLTSFSPMSMASGTTIFEDESPVDPAMFATPSSRNTVLSFETVMATPLRNNGWWDILSPISPQLLARSFTAPARIPQSTQEDDLETPLLEQRDSAPVELSRDIDSSDSPVVSTSLVRRGTQRTVPTTGEAAEYYDPSKSFEVSNSKPATTSIGTNEDKEPICLATNRPADVEQRGLSKNASPYSVSSAHLNDFNDDAIMKTPGKVTHDLAQPQLHYQAPALGSAFETPRPFAPTPGSGHGSHPGTILELSSPPVVSQAALAQVHNSEDVHTTTVQRLDMPSAEAHIVQQHTPDIKDATPDAMYYRGFSANYTAERSPSPGYDYENAYQARSPSLAAAPQTSPQIRHLYDHNNTVDELPGHEKAIAMGMDKPANYQMHDPDARSWDEKASSNRSYGRDLESGRAVRQPWKVWFRAPKLIGDKRKMSKRGRLMLIAVSIALLIIFILAVTLSMTLHQNPVDMPIGVQWLNLTNMPPIPTGISTVASPHEKQATSCVAVPDLWTCSVPKEQQGLVQNGNPTIPNFRFEVRYFNSLDKANSSSKTTQKRDTFEDILSQAAPPPPSINDRAFLGNTTDQVQPFEGEGTPFTISLLPLIYPNASSTSHTKRNTPNAPLSLNKTAAPAALYPELTAQPLHLFNRGLASEHYGFYAYFTKAVFLALPNATASLNGTITSPTPDPSTALNADGGAPRAQANTFCIWPQTRLHVSLWTRQGSVPNAPSGVGNASASDFQSPGSMPLPVTVELDRHGGDAAAKGIVCYNMDSQGRVDDSSATVVAEDRGSDGRLVNPAPAPFQADAVAQMGGWGGVDGGSGGCGCAWTNF